jgi:hypothetical protein
MSGNWLNNIKYVNPGEPVQAGVVNRPDQALAARTDYLKDRLDAAAVGQALFDSDATIAPSVLPGQPVFWNYTTHRYEAALAAVAVDQTTQVLAVQPSSDCVGICLQKKSETLGDIVLRGIVSIPELANAIDAPIAPGRYYLSGVEPGKLVKQRPGVSVGVCYVQGPKDNCSDVPRVIVMPTPRDFISEHTHYRFELVARPAGTGLSTTQRSGKTHAQIVNEDPNLPGWLPASNAIFNGKAPTGAAFGYNINKHPALANVWPPLPIQSVAVLWDRAEYQIGASEVPLGPTGLVICDTNGIWWMSSCKGETPWPEDLNPSAPVAPFDPTACPPDERMRISVVFLRMLLGNDRSVVTSLVPGPDSPITILNCDDQPATTGDLALNLNLQRVTAEAIGGEAIKEIVDGKKLKAGWVTEGAFTTSSQIRITGTRGVKRNLTVAELEDLNMSRTAVVPLQQGILKIDYTDALVEREIAPQIIRLSDTVERLYMDIPYLGFPAGQGSLLRVRLNVADSNLGDNLRMKIRVRFFGRGGTPTQAVTLPALYMSYRRLPRPAAGGSPLPTTDTTLSFNSALALKLDTVAQVDSAEFQIAEGDTVLVTLGRAENRADVYAEVGVLRISGIVYSAT